MTAREGSHGADCGVHRRERASARLDPIGVDLSAGICGTPAAGSRAPAPTPNGCHCDEAVDAVVAVMIHTDMRGYPAVLREVARVVRLASCSYTSASTPASAAGSQTAPTRMPW